MNSQPSIELRPLQEVGMREKLGFPCQEFNGIEFSCQEFNGMEFPFQEFCSIGLSCQFNGIGFSCQFNGMGFPFRVLWDWVPLSGVLWDLLSVL